MLGLSSKSFWARAPIQEMSWRSCLSETVKLQRFISITTALFVNWFKNPLLDNFNHTRLWFHVKLWCFWIYIHCILFGTEITLTLTLVCFKCSTLLCIILQLTCKEKKAHVKSDTIKKISYTAVLKSKSNFTSRTSQKQISETI